MEGGQGTDPARTAEAVTIIEVDERLAESADLASVIDSTSGVVVRRLGGLGDFSSVSIRGSSARQVQVFIDGVPLNPDGASAVNLGEIPLRAFERVELYRGNAPAAFGAAPVGGVVNLVTGDNGGSGGTLSAGAHGTARVSGHLRVDAELGEEPVALLAFSELFSTRGAYRYFSDNGTVYEVFDDSRPVRDNNDKTQLNAHLLGRVGSVTVANHWLSREEGVAGRLYAPSARVRLGTWRNLSSLRGEQTVGGLSLSQRGWLRLSREIFDDRLGEIGVGNEWERTQTSSAGVLLHASSGVSSALVPSLTVGFRRDRHRQYDLLLDRSSDPSIRLAGHLTAAADIWLLGETLKLSPVAQLDVLDNRLLGTVPFADTAIAPEGRDTQLVASPRLGVLARPVPWLALKANGGRFFRPPDFGELFGDRGGLVGSTDLVPEVGWQGDLGARAEVRDGELRAGLELAVFASDVRNLIVFVQNGQGTSVPRNVGHAATRGVETALTASLPWLDVQLNGTWTRSRNRTAEADGKQLPRVPEIELSERVSVHARGLRLGHDFSYTAGNYWDATNWYLTPPRAVHGAFLRGTSGALSLELSVLNLFDRQVMLVDRNPLDSADDTLVVQPLNDFYGFPLPGRTMMCTVRWAPSTSQETP